MKTIFAATTLLFLFSCQAQHNDQQHYTNALASESSPYLLQHAQNPVNWHPWGEEALNKAKAEDKMLIISIGYAACHWCHVMEEESFEDTSVARIMNEHFVPIKVDREERPDVDKVYMTACQLASDRGCGWPLNVFAMPDGNPVWAGTYFPRKQWLDNLEYFINLYDNEREKLEGFAAQLVEGVRKFDEIKPVSEAPNLNQDAFNDILDNYLSNIDLKKGGREGAPKFPVPNSYEFLLHYNTLTGDEKALEALTVTLDNMARGGIYDHLGGGFARYSTDENWKVPHFEKMLYDNAQLISLYAHAYQHTQKETYRKVALECLAFIKREMTSPEAGFYSSLDADSEGKEGAFYTWEKRVVDSLIGDEKLSQLFGDFYNLRDRGNWEGVNVLYQKDNVEKILTEYNITIDELNTQLQIARQKLFQARQQREHPKRDEKILTSWNALMVQAYLDAYAAFGEEDFLNAAVRCANFILDKMMSEDGSLKRNYMKGKASIDGFLDDYAFTIQALLSLYEATFEERWVNQAERILNYTLNHFQDEKSGFFFYTSDLSPALVARNIETEDNVLPSSNSVMARVLHRLGTLTGKKQFLEQSNAMLNTIGSKILDSVHPHFYSNWCALYAELAFPYYEIAIVGESFESLRSSMRKKYLPNTIFLGAGNEGKLELLKGKFQQGETYIYVCRNRLCKLPVQKVEAALKQLNW